MPKLPLLPLSKVYVAPGNVPGSDCIVWAGKTRSGLPVLLGAIWKDNQIIQIFGKELDSLDKSDKTLQELKPNLVNFPHWETQDFSDFTPGQQEEAALVRGWIIENEKMQKEAQIILDRVEGTHKEKNVQPEEPDPYRQ